MSKYIYGKYDSDTFPDELTNEFHYMCMYLGAYLHYENLILNKDSDKESKSFFDFATDNNLGENARFGFRWKFINEGQAFIRDYINNSQEFECEKVSKRQIRKLGYSGYCSVPRFPRCGIFIANTFLNTVFNKTKYDETKRMFLEFIARKWEKDDGIDGYSGGDYSSEEKIQRTAAYCCGFQDYVLNFDPSMKREFFSNELFSLIQRELEDMI